ncbi:hypothetical protein TNCV_908151 [Trichonephila clavipes]|nr:hypothetical protein TNCV_908151 [Trichonephila clavipes]
MRARAYCAHPSIPHWALRCMSRCPDQMVSLKRGPSPQTSLVLIYRSTASGDCLLALHSLWLGKKASKSAKKNDNRNLPYPDQTKTLELPTIERMETPTPNSPGRIL